MPWERRALPSSDEIEYLDGEVKTWGACRLSGLTSLFYSDDKADQAEAVSICQTCAVELECRQLAFARNEQWGVWGGMTENDRDPRRVNHRRSRQRQVHELRKKAQGQQATG